MFYSLDQEPKDFYYETLELAEKRAIELKAKGALSTYITNTLSGFQIWGDLRQEPIFNRIKHAVERDPNLDVADFWLTELMAEWMDVYDNVESDLVLCVICVLAGVKESCCDSYSKIVPVDSSNMHQVADYFDLGALERNNLTQAVGEYEEELQVA